MTASRTLASLSLRSLLIFAMMLSQTNVSNRVKPRQAARQLNQLSRQSVQHQPPLRSQARHSLIYCSQADPLPLRNTVVLRAAQLGNRQAVARAQAEPGTLECRGVGVHGFFIRPSGFTA